MICVPITSRINKDTLHAVRRNCRFADCLELRMDLIGRANLAGLMSAVRDESRLVKVIVTCRRKEEAGRTGTTVRKKTVCRSSKEKMALLKEAIERGADFIDIELAEGGRVIRELKSLCEKKGGKTGVIVSYHNLRETPSEKELKKIFDRCAKFEPAVVKIVTTAKSVEDNLKVLNLIPYAKKCFREIIALCMGEKGIISRAVAPLMGSFLSFAVLNREGRSAPGQLTVDEMKQLKALLSGSEKSSGKASLSRITVPKNFILLGNPVAQSLSPLMHNAALKQMGMDDQYSACCVRDIGEAMRGMRTMNIRGASVTIPFKESCMEYLDHIDEDALSIGAVNTVVNDNGCLNGYNTDWSGLMLTLKKAMKIEGKTFVIIGAGGTARAAVYGIIKEGGFPIIVNRTLGRAKTLADEFDCPFYPLTGVGKVSGECLINTTSLGMYPLNDKSPLKAPALKGYPYVMDVIYNPLKTKLLDDAEKQGCVILSGVDMFVNQGARQLMLWTGKEPPLALMKKVILKRLSENEK